MKRRHILGRKNATECLSMILNFPPRKDTLFQQRKSCRYLKHFLKLKLLYIVSNMKYFILIKIVEKSLKIFENKNLIPPLSLQCTDGPGEQRRKKLSRHHFMHSLLL